MIVIVLSCCPPSLRGDLTRWFFEITTNVYVGRVSARVREGIWNRIIQNCGDGTAVMIYGVDNEQRFDFKIHNSRRRPVDLDGLKIMMKPECNFTDRC